MTLTLYFAPGACARVPLIALEEAGCQFDARLVKFMAGEHKSPDYLRLNPAGKVPTLIADGVAIAQNVAILTYLARTLPDAKLLPPPESASADALVLAKLAWFSGDLHPLVTRIRMPQFFCDLPGGPDRVRALGEIGMAAQLAPLEDELGAAPWVLGADWSVLDAYLYWVWFRITGAGFNIANFPHIVAHSARMETRPAVQRALAREAAALAELENLGLAVPLPAKSTA